MAKPKKTRQISNEDKIPAMQVESRFDGSHRRLRSTGNPPDDGLWFTGAVVFWRHGFYLFPICPEHI
jgi:hypothetical protein